MTMRATAGVLALTLLSQTPSAPGPGVVRLERQLEELRQTLKIPGLSAAVIKDRKVLWTKGFGYADLEDKVPATPQTNYRIASLTKTFASVLLLQLVEQGKVDLDEPIAKFSAEFRERFGDTGATIRHVFTHTSHDTPGRSYRYDGNRFSHLSAVIEKTSGQPFREVLARNILDPAAMSGSVPGQDVLQDRARWASLLDQPHVKQYETGLARLAKPYRLYGTEVVRAGYPPRGISAAAGLLSNVEDLARYDQAIDAHRFITKASLERAWTPAVSPDGRTLPYGLGWFITTSNGVRLVWHYGYWPDSFSSLYLKVPASDLSFILLANSDALSAPFRLGNGALLQSAFAAAFVRIFVSESAAGSERTSKDLMNRWLEERRVAVRREVAVDPALYDAYAGEYEVEPGRRLSVTREGNGLFVRLFQFDKVQAFPEGNDRFFLKAQDLQLRFVKGAEGRVAEVEVNFWGQSLRARRIK